MKDIIGKLETEHTLTREEYKTLFFCDDAVECAARMAGRVLNTGYETVVARGDYNE